jgi:hypothetical protein
MKMDSNDGRKWVLPTAAAMALTGLLFLYIEVRVVQGGEALIAAVAIIAVLDIVVAALLAITRRLWVGGLSLVLLVVGAIGDLPHQIGPILNPPDAEHFIVSLLATAAQLVGIVLASLCSLTAARAVRRRRMLEAP